MANPDIGELICPLGKHTAYVRKYVNGKKLYWACPCGMIQPALPTGQEFILANATMYGPEGKPAQSPMPTALPAPELAPPAPAVAPGPAKGAPAPKESTWGTVL